MAGSEKLTEEERVELSSMKRESISRSVQALNRAVAEGRLQPHFSPSGMDPAGRASACTAKPSRQGGSTGSEAHSDGEVQQ